MDYEKFKENLNKVLEVEPLEFNIYTISGKENKITYKIEMTVESDRELIELI